MTDDMVPKETFKVKLRYRTETGLWSSHFLKRSCFLRDKETFLKSLRFTSFIIN